MPIAPTYPGVYIQEIPSGVRTITGVATSITAFLGRALRGPVDDPSTIFSFGDFERVFGGLAPDMPLGYAVRDFFLNGGSQAIIVRVFAPTGTGVAANNSTGLALLADSPGTWANGALDANNNLTSGLGVALTVFGNPNDPTNPIPPPPLTLADLFNLQIQYVPAGSLPGTKAVIENIRNVSVLDGPRRVDRVLAVESQYVHYDVNQPLPQVVPLAAPLSVFAGGLDSRVVGGNPALLPNDVIGDQNAKTGMYALDKADLFNLLCIPPDVRADTIPNATADTVASTVYSIAANYCAEHRAMLIADPPSAWRQASDAVTGMGAISITGPDARNAAIYFPRILESDPLRQGQLSIFVPCGAVAGVMSRTDSQRGVWKAPAGIDASLTGVQGLTVLLDNDGNGLLNPLGLNCLRNFSGYGNVVWGARTLRGADQIGDEYKYVPIRRLALYIEESLFRGLKWVVFEPNDEPLWSQIRLNVGAFMHDLFRQGAFQGQTPKDAYFVKCDGDTTTQNDRNLGIVNIIVGFAPLKPAEFVVLYLQQMAGQIQV